MRRKYIDKRSFIVGYFYTVGKRQGWGSVDYTITSRNRKALLDIKKAQEDIKERSNFDSVLIMCISEIDNPTIT